jgi:hypothetical protein
MTPDFLEERRASLETALVVLLDACRQVGGGRGGVLVVGWFVDVTKFKLVLK